jgi:hypothetical protein
MKNISYDLVMRFGDATDGVIEIPGLTRDGQVVEIGYYFPKPKNIIGISSHAGCISRCSFCELGDEPYVRNLTPQEMYDQVALMLTVAWQEGIRMTEQHKVNVAKTGEPLLNPALAEGMQQIGDFGVSYKVSSVLPDTPRAWQTLEDVAHFAQFYQEPVQLQVSLISTDDDYRRHVAGIRVASLDGIRQAGELWHGIIENPRKVNLSLILAEETIAKAEDVFDILPPHLFNFRFRDYVPTMYGQKNGLTPISTKRMQDIKQDFNAAGYDVSSWATPTPTEARFHLAANVTRSRYMAMVADRSDNVP